MSVCHEYGFQSSLALAELEMGMLLIAQQQDEAGIDRIHNGLELYKAMGTDPRPTFRLDLATAYSRLDQMDQAWNEIEYIRQFYGATDEVRIAAELQLLQGALHLRQAAPNEPGAAACFQRALDIARQQRARAIEL